LSHLYRTQEHDGPHFGDEDGKSQTTSAADGEHYPTTAEIAERAYHLWLERGCPEGSDEQNWLEAERELHDAGLSRRLTEINHEKAGSVQS
jgi:hypothetical protein